MVVRGFWGSDFLSAEEVSNVKTYTGGADVGTDATTETSAVTDSSNDESKTGEVASVYKF